ncbi:MAG: Cna B-type domain-containing protein, partial [Clostridia bacterium]|nr:Cna B-type domain-containing protein [Clostridia bacterium]
VRTFDTVNYTVSTIMRPNADVEGVEETSVFYGGTIKVKATIPAVDEQSHFKWVQQAWMQNVSMTDDGRTLYAEYKIADTQKSAPGVQNLNFEMKAEGYVTKEGEQAPKPTFEIYMEGNKEENEESTKEKVIIKDEKELYITGRPAFNIRLVKGNINHEGIYHGQKGYYMNFGISISLYQDIEEIGDIRGLEYPVDSFSSDLKLTFSYYDKTNNIGWIEVDENDEKGYGVINGIKLVAYDLAYNDNDAYWPSGSIRVNGITSVKGDNNEYAIHDSGKIFAELNNDILNIKFDDYVINGRFPKTQDNKQGVFNVGQIEIFAPLYDEESDINYQYQVNVKTVSASYNTLTQNNQSIEYVDDILQDKVLHDNQLVWTNEKGNGKGGYINTINAVYPTSNIVGYSPYNINLGDAFIVSGQNFWYEGRVALSNVVCYGGQERIILWRADAFKLEDYNNEKTVYIYNGGNGVFPRPSFDNVIYKYGVYKGNDENILNSDELIEEADFEDFDWYDTIEEIEFSGNVVSSVYINDPDHLGYDTYRNVVLKFRATNDKEYLYTNYPIRQKVKAYRDEERNDCILGGYTEYLNTEYNEYGEIENGHIGYNLGQNLLIIPYNTTVTTSVEDLANNNRPKTTYDVQEREINFSIVPKLSIEKEATDNDEFVDKVQVVDYLPKGLIYVEGSANKEPVSVILNEETGVTEIVWEYENWQIDHEAPEYPKITFQAEMSYILKNNEKITNKVIISTVNDWSNEKSRTGSYGITIVNLAGLGVEKSTDTPVVEINSDIRFETEVVSGSDKDLTNIRMLDILPYNGDENGTHFTGEYTLKEVNIPDDITGYYTTLPLDKLETDGGLTRDQNGKLSAVGVDLENNDNWTKIEEGKVAEDTTAFIFVKEVLTSGESSKIGYTILPRGNQAGDEYGSSANVTVDSFTGVIKSNIQIDKVIERKISGRVFEDKNQNGIKEETEELLSGIKVRLLDKQGNEAIDVEGSKVESVTTDENGYYEFSSLPKGEYIVEFLVDGTKYEATKKLVGEDETINSNINAVKNNSARTDILTKLNTEEKLELIEEENINAGLITYVDIEAIKKWEDNANEPQKRPDSINLILYADGIENERVEVNEESNWRTVFKKKLKYDSNGKEIIYTIDEDYSNKFYEKTIDKNEVTNTFKVPDEKVEIEVLKIWEDEENKANKRPESIELIVKAEGKEVARKTVTENDNWRYTFELPKYDRLGNEIEYTVDEEFESKFYVKEITENVITNRFVVPDDRIELTVEKEWNDQNDKYGKRPESVVVQIVAKGEIITEYAVNKKENWIHTFELPKYDSLGNEVEYSIVEKEVRDYESKIEGNKIINTCTYEPPVETSDKNIWIYLIIFLIAIVGIISVV